MTRAERRLPAWAAWCLGGALVVAAWFVALGTPDEDHVQASFPVPVAVGEQGVGRNIAATITDIRRTSALTADDWSAEGNWVVVELDVSAVTSEESATLSHAELVVDGVRYSASERPDSLRGWALSAGIPHAGGLAFELPEGLDSGDVTLELALAPLYDTRLDSVIVTRFDLGSVPVTTSDELPETDWAHR